MKKLLSLVAVIIATTAFCQQITEATITVIGTGVNEEQATLQGLRSAIEQTFGTFVSANTTILNDKFVRDDIIAISNGNIKHYDKLAVATMPNGQICVTLQAVVSINKLISYAKSKGSKAEFEGQSYAANTKYMQLRAENAQKLLKNTEHQIYMLSKNLYEVSLKLKDPSLMYRYQTESDNLEQDNHETVILKYCEDVYSFPATICFYSNASSHNIYKLYTEAINAIQISSEENANFERNNIATCYIYNPKDKNYVWVPISSEQWASFLSDIAEDLVKNRILKVQVREIGNFVNLYEFTGLYHSVIYASAFSNEKKGGLGKEGYYYKADYYDRIWWVSKERNTRLENMFFSGGKSYGNYIFYCNNRLFQNDFYRYGVPDNYALDEMKIPITLTKEQARLKKKGLYDAPLYKIKYGDPQLIHTIPVQLLIPVDKMNTFKGFEVLFKE